MLDWAQRISHTSPLSNPQHSTDNQHTYTHSHQKTRNPVNYLEKETVKERESKHTYQTFSLNENHWRHLLPQSQRKCARIGGPLVCNLLNFPPILYCIVFGRFDLIFIHQQTQLSSHNTIDSHFSYTTHSKFSATRCLLVWTLFFYILHVQHIHETRPLTFKQSNTYTHTYKCCCCH